MKRRKILYKREQKRTNCFLKCLVVSYSRAPAAPNIPTRAYGARAVIRFTTRQSAIRWTEPRVGTRRPARGSRARAARTPRRSRARSRLVSHVSGGTKSDSRFALDSEFGFVASTRCWTTHTVRGFPEHSRSHSPDTRFDHSQNQRNYKSPLSKGSPASRPTTRRPAAVESSVGF